MAIRVMPFYAIVLRPFVLESMAREGWMMLVHHAARGTFDGEIMAFGAMNPREIENHAEYLEQLGFKGPQHNDEADFALFQSGMGKLPTWLEIVDVKHFADGPEHDSAWKLKNSEVYTLHDFHFQPQYPTKGYEVDWPPYIGKISG